MGNCQASDAVASIVEYPSGRIDKLYWSVTARHLMLQNPGHYVAVYVWSKSSHQSRPRLKLLPPASILSAGKCYRLVTYEEVVGDLCARRGIIKIPKGAVKQGNGSSRVVSEGTLSALKNVKTFSLADQASSDESKPTNRPGQWRPSLQSIAETAGS